MIFLATIGLLSLAITAATMDPDVQERSSASCLTDTTANQVAENYANVIRNYSQTLVDNAFSPRFIEYSESTNSLIDSCPHGKQAVKEAKNGLPLLGPSFANREAYNHGQSQQPPLNFDILRVEHNCNTITLLYNATIPVPIPETRPVVGFVFIDVVKAPAGSKYTWLIGDVYTEYDSLAYLQNIQEAGACEKWFSVSLNTPLPSGFSMVMTASSTATSSAEMSS